MKYLFVILFLMLPALALAQSSDEDLAEPCQTFTENAEFVDFTLVMDLENRDVAMRVPKVFLEDAWKQQNGARHTAILFTATIGSFEPVTREETRDLNFEYTSFLINDYIDLPKIAELYLDSASPGRTSPRESLSDYTMRPFQYRLEEVIPNYPEELQANVYLHKDRNGEIDSVISCKTVQAAQFPTCQQFFRSFSNIDIKFHYPIRYLPIWERMQSNIDRFVECAVIGGKL